MVISLVFEVNSRFSGQNSVPRYSKTALKGKIIVLAGRATSGGLQEQSYFG
jgi:hypothetical protein